MYDAWAAYDRTAVGTQLGGSLRRPAAEATLYNKNEAVSFAAYRALVDLFPSTQDALFTQQMQSLGYDVNDTSTDTAHPDGIGNTACATDLAYFHNDGSNQSNGYADTTGYTAPNPSPNVIVDPNGWQPLAQANGQPTKFLTPQWAHLKLFALTSASEFRPGPPATTNDPLYAQQAANQVAVSAGLTDAQKVQAEYWEDGPAHMCFFAEFISQRDRHTLDDDIKMFFTMMWAMEDANVSVWDAKIAYDSERPYTAVHYVYGGKPIQAWGGPGKGTVTMDGSQFQSYIVTPSFGEHSAGHGAFCAAAAYVFETTTGSNTANATFTEPAGASLIEPGITPAQPVTLSWPTWNDVVTSCGQSRVYGGVHFQLGIDESETQGNQVATAVYQKAQAFFNGTAPSLASTNRAAR
jgi:hypothetical protein